MCARDQALSAEAVALIKKKLKDKSPMTSVLALHLLEALMKNWYDHSSIFHSSWFDFFLLSHFFVLPFNPLSPPLV